MAGWITKFQCKNTGGEVGLIIFESNPGRPFCKICCCDKSLLYKFNLHTQPVRSKTLESMAANSQAQPPTPKMQADNLCCPSHARCNMKSHFILMHALKPALTAPVPKLMSTSSASQIIGMRRWLRGCTANLPCRCLYLYNTSISAGLNALF